MNIHVKGESTLRENDTALLETVSAPHPEAMKKMLAGKSEITAHLGSPPYQYQELDDRRVRLVMNSYSVLGGMSTFNLVWTQHFAPPWSCVSTTGNSLPK